MKLPLLSELGEWLPLLDKMELLEVQGDLAQQAVKRWIERL